MRRIGVFVCHCGINISSTINIADVVAYVQQLPDVVTAKDYTYMCSEPGQELIRDHIAQYGLDRVVVASCSPTMHEVTFREVVKTAGLNPFCFEMANIREQCSWVHPDKQRSTEKAKAILNAAVSRVSKLEPLEEKVVGVTPSVMVVGAGIAGIQASLDIANAGYKVYLVEKDPSVGGRMAQLDKTFPTLDCAACILTPKMSEVGRHPNIDLMTYSEVEDVDGYVGNFKVTIKRKPRFVNEEKCTGCGDCSIACPIKYQPLFRSAPEYPELADEDKARIDEMITAHGRNEESLIQIMQDINLHYGFLPLDILKYVSLTLDVPLSRVFHVATFYTAFRLQQRGKHTIKVCMGTACYARGAPNILDEFERQLNIHRGETTADMRFTLETVNCLGCCAIGPVVLIDEDYLTVTAEKVEKVLKAYE
jgi:NADH:ubiquinone oxidoreductase subunit E/NAD-dependent dihydropyrimidine dehydrogenase PreA subunit